MTTGFRPEIQILDLTNTKLKC